LQGCEHCGLMISNSCVVTGVKIEPENRKLYEGCAYFVKPLFEDGKAMDPARLLLIAENEIRRRK